MGRKIVCVITLLIMCFMLSGCVAVLAIKGAQGGDEEQPSVTLVPETVEPADEVPVTDGDDGAAEEPGTPKATSIPTSERIGNALGEVGNGIIKFAGEMGNGIREELDSAASAAAEGISGLTEDVADATVDTALTAVDKGLEFRNDIIEGGIETVKEGVVALKEDIGGLKEQLKKDDGAGEDSGEEPEDETYEEVPEGPYHILSVVDGDTIKLEEFGKDVRFRLIGIDTPESVASDEYLENSGKQNTAEGKDASAFMKEYLPKGTGVYIGYDAGREDKYGRQLIYLWKDGVFVNELLLKEGYAKLFTLQPNVRYADNLFLEAERYARENGKGFWGTGFFEE